MKTAERWWSPLSPSRAHTHSSPTFCYPQIKQIINTKPDAQGHLVSGRPTEVLHIVFLPGVHSAYGQLPGSAAQGSFKHSLLPPYPDSLEVWEALGMHPMSLCGQKCILLGTGHPNSSIDPYPGKKPGPSEGWPRET